MRVLVTRYKSEAPIGEYLQEGKDYTDHDDELEVENAILLLQRLRWSRSRIFLKGESCTADFELKQDASITIELTSLNGFWAISEVSDREAESIVRRLYGGEDFGGFIPGSDQEWGAWGDGT
jgi:hypothetical protein